MKIKLIHLFFILFILSGCVGASSKGVFGTGVSVALDPRSLGTQIDDSIMDKNLETRLLLLNKNYFLSVKTNLPNKFFCIIESSICVPNVLGSRAILTPVPNTPPEEEPTQDDNKSKINNIKIFFFILFFQF